MIIGGAAAIGLYMAWSIGANDVANSMASAVGAKAITFKQAVLIAGVLNFIGAVFVGEHVVETVKGGIVDVAMISNSSILLFGFISSLLAAALWVTLSTWYEMPISTSHTVVGAVIGVGLARGLEAVDLGVIKKIVISWIVTLPVAAVTSIGLFLLLTTIFL